MDKLLLTNAKALFSFFRKVLTIVGICALIFISIFIIRNTFHYGPELNSLSCILEPREPLNRHGGEPEKISSLEVLSKSQKDVATWLSRKYRVGIEPISTLVTEAQVAAEKNKLDSHLLLALIAIESNFNPYAQSNWGAKGLMQIVTQVHVARFEKYGGIKFVFDPVINLHLGAEILRDSIALKDGSIEDGLLFYVGRSTGIDSAGYVSKVLLEKSRLEQVAGGNLVPTQ